MNDILQPLLMVAIGIGAGWLLFYLRTRVFINRTTDAPLANTLALIGLQRRGNLYHGTLDGFAVALEPLAPEGYRITVHTAAPFPGEVRLSGPSDSAASAQPEAKIRVGDGQFDYHFWVLKTTPHDAAADLLMPHPEARATLLQMPFGTWIIAGKTLTYQTRKVALVNLPEVIRYVVQVAKILSPSV